MERKQRKGAVVAKNANIKIEGAVQEKVESKILKALKKKECRKTDLYRKLGRSDVNGRELDRILAELEERKLISKRPISQSYRLVYLWALYDHPEHVKYRETEERRKREQQERMKAWQLKRRREEIREEFKEFIADEGETLMYFTDHLVTTVLRLGSQPAFHFSIPIDDIKTIARRKRCTTAPNQVQSLLPDSFRSERT